MRRVNPGAIAKHYRLFHKVVALAWRQRPSVDPYGARAAASSPSGTFVNQPRVRKDTAITHKRSCIRHR